MTGQFSRLRVGVAIIWWLVMGAWLLLAWGLVALARVAVFAAGPLDELVTAWLGLPAVLPRVRRWWRVVRVEWRAYRAGAVDMDVVDVVDVMDGVWR